MKPKKLPATPPLNAADLKAENEKLRAANTHLVTLLRALRNQLTKLAGAVTTDLGE